MGLLLILAGAVLLVIVLLTRTPTIQVIPLRGKRCLDRPPRPASIRDPVDLVGVPIQVVVNRDRWQETEGDSGSAFNDVIRGTDDVPGAIGGAGFTGCDALDPAGVARISGLSTLVTTFPT